MADSNGPLRKTRNKLRNDPRERGTSPPRRAVREFEDGETVHLSLDPSVPDGRFHPRFNGRTGTVTGTQGAAYRVEISDGNGTKTVIAKPSHLTPREE